MTGAIIEELGQLSKALLEKVRAIAGHQQKWTRDRGSVHRALSSLYQFCSRINPFSNSLTALASGISGEEEQKQLQDILKAIRSGVEETSRRFEEAAGDLAEKAYRGQERRLQRIETDLEDFHDHFLNRLDGFFGLITNFLQQARLPQSQLETLAGSYQAWFRFPSENTTDPIAELLKPGKKDLSLGDEQVRRMLERSGLHPMAREGGEWCIGSGRFSRVYRCCSDDKVNKRIPLYMPLAVKVAIDPFLISAFQKEAERERDSLEKLKSSPSVIRLYDYKASGFPILVYELFEGTKLSEWLESANPPPEDRLFILLQILDAIQVGCESGVIHGDLAPHNILISTEVDEGYPIVKVVDYGLSKMVGSAYTQTNLIGGTLRYLPPELEDVPQKPHPASDLYSAGQLVEDLFPGSRSEVLSHLMDGLTRNAPSDRLSPREALRRIARELSPAPRYAVGTITQRSSYIQRHFDLLLDALRQIEKVAQSHHLTAPQRKQLIGTGELDPTMGNPRDPSDHIQLITQTVKKHFDRPYQIAFMGIFSSGKTSLINKLLTCMQGHTIEPYQLKMPYESESAFEDHLKPSLRRSTAEPTDQVITIIRAFGKTGDAQLLEQLQEHIRSEDPQWQQQAQDDVVEFPLDLEELKELNFVDTPGLNEKNEVNEKVGRFLGNCDLIVYTMAATNVMNIQDQFLITRTNLYDTGKRVIYLVNMIDVLLDRLRFTRFWEHPEVIEEIVEPLKRRVENQVEELTGAPTSLTYGSDFRAVSGLYHYGVEKLYADLKQIVRTTAGVDRLRGAARSLQYHCDQVLDFCRSYIGSQLRPRKDIADQALEHLDHCFTEAEEDLTRTWGEWIDEQAKEHAIGSKRFLPTCSMNGHRFGPKQGEGWSERFLSTVEQNGSPAWSPAGRVKNHQYPILQALQQAIAGDDQHPVWMSFDQEILEESSFARVRQILERARERLPENAEELKQQTVEHVSAFTSQILPEKVRQVQEDTQIQMDEICQDLVQRRLPDHYQEAHLEFARPDSPEEAVAQSLLEGELQAPELESVKATVGKQEISILGLIQSRTTEIDKNLEDELTMLAGQRRQILSDLREKLKHHEQEAIFHSRSQIPSAIESQIQFDPCNKPLRKLVSDTVGQEKKRRRKTIVRRALGGLSLLLIAALSIYAALTLSAWFLTATLIWMLLLWWLTSQQEMAFAQQQSAEEQLLQEAWNVLMSRMTRSTIERLEKANDQMNIWHARFGTIHKSEDASLSEIKKLYRDIFQRLHSQPLLRQWHQCLHDLQQE